MERRWHGEGGWDEDEDEDEEHEHAEEELLDHDGGGQLRLGMLAAAWSR